MNSLSNNQNNTNHHNDLMYENTDENLSPNHSHLVSGNHANHSAVSWGAVLAGTVAAAALSLALIILGIGFGMSSISVWSGQGISAGTLGLTTIIWLAFTQIIAYGMGGYLAGRLRTKWVSVHSDEVYFRDTAHGFLTWALSSLLCATLLASVIGSIASGTAKTGATVLGGASSAAITGVAANADGMDMPSNNNPLGYMVGTLFRKDVIAGAATTDNTSGEFGTDMDGNTLNSSSPSNVTKAKTDQQAAEVTSIFMNSMNAESLPSGDVKYIGQLVSQQTGLPQAEAEGRVAMAFAMLQEKRINAMEVAKETAEKARKTAAYTALWGFVFLLVGAFSASLAATWGGRSRDN
ncbi:MAG: hypothetical protein V4570_09000 [Pseudomonadota bacterium]